MLTGVAAALGAVSGAVPDLAQVLSPPCLVCAVVGQYLAMWGHLKKLNWRAEQFRTAALE